MCIYIYIYMYHGGASASPAPAGGGASPAAASPAKRGGPRHCQPTSGSGFAAKRAAAGPLGARGLPFGIRDFHLE